MNKLTAVYAVATIAGRFRANADAGTVPEESNEAMRYRAAPCGCRYQRAGDDGVCRCPRNGVSPERCP